MATAAAGSGDVSMGPNSRSEAPTLPMELVKGAPTSAPTRPHDSPSLDL